MRCFTSTSQLPSRSISGVQHERAGALQGNIVNMKRLVALRATPVLAALALAIAALLPAALTLPQHGDEAQYIWSAAYFGGRVARLDFRPQGDDPQEALWAPGWSPNSWWART